MKAKEGNVLKLSVEPLLTPLQAVFFELASEMTDAKLETDMMKKKAEKLHQNQKHNKTPTKEWM